MENNKDTKAGINRQQFLQYTAGAGAAMLFSTLEGLALETPQKKLRVALIGCGSVSNRYIPHLQTSSLIQIVSLCDIKYERAVNQNKQYNVNAQTYPHIDKMLAGVPFDMMVTTTDMQEHERLNRQAVMAGKHVWSEKPMANSYAAGKALYDLAKSKKLRIWGAPAVVNSPQFEYMSKAIQEGKLGKVASAHGQYGHTGPTWSSFFYEKGGGSMPDLGVYNFGTLTGLLGPAKSVVAMTSTILPERETENKGKVKVEAEDNAMVLMEHANGVISHVQCGFNYFDPYGHEGSGQDRPTISIWGRNANMNLVGYDWAPFGVDMATVENEKTVRYVPDPGKYVWQQGASVICESLVTGIEPLINAEHALHVLEVMQAARESQSAGKRIALQSTFPYPVVK